MPELGLVPAVESVVALRSVEVVALGRQVPDELLEKLVVEVPALLGLETNIDKFYCS